MAHFAFICVPSAGHIDPLAALAGEVVRRGHRATFLHHPDVAPLIARRGLDFHPIGGALVPAGSLAPALETASRVRGPLGLLPLIRNFARGTAMFCDTLPDALRALSIDAIVSDWIEPAGGLVAHHLKLPYVSVAAALPLNWEAGVPSPFVGWSHGETRWHRYRDAAAQYVAQAMQRPMRDVIDAYTARWALGPHRSVQDYASGYAQIAQLTPSLDYPRRFLTGCFHYCGPLRAPASSPGPGARRERTGRAFATLGSLQGHRADIFERIADATAAVGLQLTIAHGGRLAAADAARLSKRATLRDFVSYERMFQSTDVAILHGGMNGTMDALAQGVPIVTVPLAFEQASIAERTRRAGAGLVCRPRALKTRLAGVLREVVGNPTYADAAARLADEIRRAGGVARAVDIVEQVARTGRPCLNAAAIAADPRLAPYAPGADLAAARHAREPRAVEMDQPAAL